jgi:uncharacterized protein (UPF0548 family)
MSDGFTSDGNASDGNASDGNASHGNASHGFEDARDELFTYDAVGATGSGASSMPAGYHELRRSTIIGRGREAFGAAGEALMSWQMHRDVGLHVTASGPRAEPGVVAAMRIGPRRVGIGFRCRVVYSVNEDRRIGFAYGTLPGHPESGEEAFVVEHLPNDDVVFEVIAFSRPARWFTRIGGPLSRIAQNVMLRRYARALKKRAGGRRPRSRTQL